ncbi:MAG: Strictosidine synthase, conserved region [Pseudoduganella sp.]|jgi:sugar lactone lactonase YvrE|nr:Strictosidine synthase, conserved region [Pseudoduganella sp.]
MTTARNKTLLLALALIGYLALWPVPAEPVAWQAPAAPGYTGAHAANDGLRSLRQIDLGGEQGPEHVALGPDGMLYTGVVSGKIVRMAPDGSAQQAFASTGGRPLGLAFDAAGALLVADAVKGLLSVARDGSVSLLTNSVDGTPVRFADAVTVAASGKVYFTDASTRFGPAPGEDTVHAATLDIIEQTSTGRVLEYDPATQGTRVVASGFSFANGIAASNDGQHLLVAESGKYRLWKIAAGARQLDIAQAAQGTAQAQVLFDNLPGYPDNVTRGLDGKYWLGLAGQRNDLDRLAQYPFLRKVALRIPRALWKTPPPRGHVFAFTEDGTVLTDLQDASGDSPLTTGVTEVAGRIYIHNANAGVLEWRAAPTGSADGH